MPYIMVSAHNLVEALLDNRVAYAQVIYDGETLVINAGWHGSDPFGTEVLQVVGKVTRPDSREIDTTAAENIVFRTGEDVAVAAWI